MSWERIVEGLVRAVLVVEALRGRVGGPFAVAYGSGFRETQGEGGALSLSAPHRDLPAVRGGHVLDDGEAETGPAGGARARRVHTVEPLEDAVPVPFRYPDALVGHRDLDQVAAGSGDTAPGDPDAGACRGVVDGVLDEVAQGRRELAAISPYVQVISPADGHGDLFRAVLR